MFISSIKEISRLLKEIDRLSSKGLSKECQKCQKYLKVTSEKD